MPYVLNEKDWGFDLKRDLIQCGIEVVSPMQEISHEIIGKLGDFIFTHQSSYWIVTGALPFAVADELYIDPLGRGDVRVAGYSGGAPPEKWAKRIDGKLFVTCYHIDSKAGLRLFADTLKRHGLV